MATEVDVDPAIFSSLSKIERNLATIELVHLRQKEHALSSTYTRRSALLRQIPQFWSQVLTSPAAPQELTHLIRESDSEILESLIDFKVERYQIESDGKGSLKGDPRSLRFTLEFAENVWFSDRTVVKELEYVTRPAPGSSTATNTNGVAAAAASSSNGQMSTSENAMADEEVGRGGFVSKPITLKWSNKSRKAGINKLLDGAHDLYKAEMAIGTTNGTDGIPPEVRETVWQYEKLRDELERQAMLEDDEDSEGDDEDGVGFLNFLGYRGMCLPPKASEDGEDEDEDEDDEDDGMLDVEIFPTGEAFANMLAEDVWPDCMDLYIASQNEDMEDEIEFDDSEDEDSDDEEAPELVSRSEGEFTGFGAAEEANGIDIADAVDQGSSNPRKRQRRS